MANYDIPFVITSHGPDIIGYNESNRYHIYANKAAEYCKKIIAVSNKNKEKLEKIYSKYKNKIIIVPNGYNPNIFYREKYTKEDLLKFLNIEKKYNKIVCFAGRLSYNKGIDILLKSAKIYEKEDVLTIIAGYGSEYDKLKKIKDDLELKNVIFVGEQNHENLRKIYNASDVCAVPSREEAFGLVALEAIACGTPVIATKHGGMTHFVTKEVGILVDRENELQLAQGINKILNEEIVFNKDVLQNYAIENYSQDKLIDKLINVYEEAIMQGENNEQ